MASTSMCKVGAKRSTASCSSCSSASKNKTDHEIICKKSRCGSKAWQRRSRAVPKPHVTKVSAQDEEHLKRIVHHFTGCKARSITTPYDIYAQLPAIYNNGTSSPAAAAAAVPSHPPAIPTLAAQFDPPSCGHNDQLLAGRSAIAQSLRSTLHIISACLCLLQSSPQPVDAAMILRRNSELDAHKSKMRALLQAINQYSELPMIWGGDPARNINIGSIAEVPSSDDHGGRNYLLAKESSAACADGSTVAQDYTSWTLSANPVDVDHSCFNSSIPCSTAAALVDVHSSYDNGGGRDAKPSPPAAMQQNLQINGTPAHNTIMHHNSIMSPHNVIINDNPSISATLAGPDFDCLFPRHQDAADTLEGNTIPLAGGQLELNPTVDMDHGLHKELEIFLLDGNTKDVEDFLLIPQLHIASQYCGL